MAGLHHFIQPVRGLNEIQRDYLKGEAVLSQELCTKAVCHGHVMTYVPYHKLPYSLLFGQKKIYKIIQVYKQQQGIFKRNLKNRDRQARS